MSFLNKLCSVRKIDNHIIFILCGVQIKIKYKSHFNCPTVKDIGVTNNKRDTKVIVSLTTFPGRINSVHKTISTLLTQTLKPDEVILWLAEAQFPKKELPEQLTNLQQYGLTIKWCEDLRSYKKLIPALEEYPNDIIITVDDDLYYAEDTVETLYNSYIKYPKNIHAHRCGQVFLKKNKIEDVSMRKLYFAEFEGASYFYRQIGYGAVLYPPNSLYGDVLDRKKFTILVPTHDDIWFWVMAVLNNTKIRSVKGYNESVNYVEDTQQVGLCKINKAANEGGSVTDAIEKLSELYPKFMCILEEESV